MADLSIIIPVKNEEKNIPHLMERVDKALSQSNISYEMVIIDDHSTDGTLQAVQKLSREYPIRIQIKKGKPGKAFSILEGMGSTESEYIVMLDADLQYPPEVIPEMFSLLKKHGVVVAKRIVYKGTFLRKIASRMIAAVFGTALFGLHTDVQSGLKLFRRDIVPHIDTKSVNAWSLDIPLLVTAVNLGYTIGHVDVTFERRKTGESKINHFQNAFEIAYGALRLKMARKHTYRLPPKHEKTMEDAGVVHKRRRYVTHTTLPIGISALSTLTSWQKFTVIGIASALLSGLVLAPMPTIIAVVAVLSAIYFIDVLFNLLLVMRSLQNQTEISVSEEELEKLDNAALPIYSILVPLYREAHVVSQFVDSIKTLEYPKSKLDVQLLLEEDDKETIAEIKKMDFPSWIRITKVPDSQPKTKPKACNYGLSRARGEYTVIYDAEDKPDPLQLKKAIIAFAKAPRETICLQAKLNYYNPHHNLLTRLFTAEYSLWFDITLSGLQSVGTTIPLGGTSNHFRTNDLLKLRGWDPFNVTEDCDLGIRLFNAGYKTAIIDSTTLEEANSNVSNWIRQRSRWIKGYIQTYFVHMRNPFSLVKNMGWHALFFQLIIGGKISFLFINPFLWAATIAYFTLYAYVGPAIESVYPTYVFYIAASSLVFGNFLFLYYYMIGCAKRKQWTLMKYIFVIPFYWLMVSYAATIALFQFLFKPHYWEKTIHGFHLIPQSTFTHIPISVYEGVSENAPRKPFPNIKISGLTAGGLLITASLIGNVCNFLYNSYLTRTIGVEEFGLVSLFGTLLLVIQIGFTALGQTMTHRSGFLLGKYRKAVIPLWYIFRKRAFSASLVVSILWVFASPLLSRFFQTESVLPFILFAPVWIIGLLASVDGGFLSGNLRFGELAALLTTEASSKLGFSILIVSLGFPQFTYAAIPLSMTITMLLGWTFVRTLSNTQKEISHREASYFPKRFFATSILSRISIITFLTADVLLAKHFLEPTEAGEYALLSLVGKMIFFLGTLFSQFVMPLVSREEGAGRTSHIVFYNLLVLTSIAAVSGFLMLGVFGEITVPILYGDRAVAIFGSLVPYTLALTYVTIAGTIVSYHQSKKEYIFPVTSFVMSIIQIVGIYLYHADIQSITEVMLFSGTVYLVSMILLHVFYRQFYSLTHNSTDLVDLFTQKSMAVGQANMRILIFNWRDTKHVWAGGAEVYIHEIAKQWVAAGHQVTVFCGNDGKHSRNQRVDGVQIIRRGGFYTVYIWAFLYYVLRFRGIFDVVIDSANGIPFFTPLFVRKPTFLLIHHVHQKVFRENLALPLAYLAMFIEKHLAPFVYRGYDIITVSQSSKTEIIDSGLSKNANITVIPPGVDTKSFSRMAKTTFPSFLYLGRLKPYKNVDVIIRAFSNVLKDHANARLTIAGDGESMKSLVVLVLKLGIQEHVEFLGKVSEKEKAILMAKSWVALQPSSMEGWGITVIEANASGTPVIASNVSGLKDSVLFRKTGLLVPPKQANAFSRAMIELIENTRLRTSLSKEATAWAATFLWEKSATQLFTIMVERMRKAHTSPNIAIART